MATTWTQSNIAELEAAIAKGAVIEQMVIGGQTFIFRSLEEMRGLLADMKREVGVAAGTTPTFRIATVDRGYR